MLPMLAFGMKTIELTDQNSITFNEAFTVQYVAGKQLELFNLALTSPEKDLYIVMYTPGGSVSAGSLFIDTVSALNKKVHTITIFSASMGYHTVQGLGKRYILPSGTLMSHRAAVSGLSGQFPGELITRINMLMESTLVLDRAASKRVGMSLSNYKAAIHDELWVTGQDAVDQGHADEVVKARCGQGLGGTYEKTFFSIFGPISVSFSKCPLIVGPVSVNSDNKAALDFLMETEFNNIRHRIRASI